MENPVPVLSTCNLTSALARTTSASQHREIKHFVMNHQIQSTCLVALATRQWLCFPLVPGLAEYDTTEGKFRAPQTGSCCSFHPVSVGWDADTDHAFTDTGACSCCGQLGSSLFTNPEKCRGNSVELSIKQP